MIETVPSGTVLHRRYRIERVLGSGGFGHVYLAIDLLNNQQYAVKEYLVTGDSGQEQLQHEASVLRHLSHPNLPAFQTAFTELGRYYIVLSYIEGNDLTDLIRMARQHNEVVPIHRILSWILAVCDAVMFLHKQQPIVIHRDIKPDNIRITPSGTAMLVDMGNAKAAADGVRTLFFIRHQGTPGYAPPEQYPGGTGTDARSDIYALGGTLYFALTAHEPPSVSVRNQSLQQGRPTLPSLQENLANNPPEGQRESNAMPPFKLGVTKPSKPAPHHLHHLAQLGTLSPQLLKQLDTVIQKAMELAPKDRYNSVTDFARDLQRVAKALPVASPPSPSPAPAHPFDPNSTQPDMQEVYDAIQAGMAKEQLIQKQGRSSANTPQLVQNQQHRFEGTCPHCGTPLSAHATLCIGCGIALGSAKTVLANTNIKDISAEQTLLIRPSPLKQAVATHTAKPQTTNPPASFNSPTSSPAQPNPPIGGVTPAPTLTQVAAPQIMQSPIYISQPQSPTQGPHRASPTRLKIGPGLAFSVVAILLVLIAAAILVIYH
jgi:serine/threonine protein kinase